MALFSRKNLKDSKDTYTFDDLSSKKKRVLVTWPERIGVYNFYARMYYEIICYDSIWNWSSAQDTFQAIKDRIILSKIAFDSSSYKNYEYKCYLLDNVVSKELYNVYTSLYRMVDKKILYEDVLDVILSRLKNTNIIPIDIVDK